MKESMKKIVKKVLGVWCLVLGAWCAVAAPSVSIDKVQQRWPWNGKVDVDYTLGGLAENNRYNLALTFTSEGRTFTTNLTGAAVTAGSHTFVFDGGTAFDNITNSQINVKAELNEAVPIDTGSVVFADKSVTYDGNAQSIDVPGNLPDGISSATVTYTKGGNPVGSPKDAGTYVATLAFAVSDERDYVVPAAKTATLTITAGTITVTVTGNTNLTGSKSVEFTIDMPAVQLWAGGPYWATCNVGATKPEESGYYFWWGDTDGYVQSEYIWVNVKTGASIQFSENDTTARQTYYNDVSTLKKGGWIDSSDNLTAAHDAARAHLGGSWRMPTSAEMQALVDKCTCERKDNWNGVAGLLVKGNSFGYMDKSIFLPAAGYGKGSSLMNLPPIGRYWSSTLFTDSFRSHYLNFVFGASANNFDDRFLGMPVRPVK